MNCFVRTKKGNAPRSTNKNLHFAEFESILLDLGHEVLPALDQPNNEHTTDSSIFNLYIKYSLHVCEGVNMTTLTLPFCYPLYGAHDG